MKHTKFIGIVLFLLTSIAVMVSSCKKEEVITEITGNESFYKVNLDENFIELSDSQIYEIGRKHNYYLDLMLKEIKFSTLTDSNFDHAIKVVLHKILIEGLTVKQQLDIYDSLKNYDYSLPTQKMNFYKQKIKTVITNNVFYKDIKHGIKVLYKKIDKDDRLDKKEKQSLKIMCSVAIYSTYFWLDKEHGGSGQGYYYISQNKAVSGKDIALSDALGGAAGAIKYSWTMFVTGGFALPAYVGAIVGGAVEASLTTAVVEAVKK